MQMDKENLVKKGFNKSQISREPDLDRSMLRPLMSLPSIIQYCLHKNRIFDRQITKLVEIQ